MRVQPTPLLARTANEESERGRRARKAPKEGGLGGETRLQLPLHQVVCEPLCSPSELDSQSVGNVADRQATLCRLASQAWCLSTLCRTLTISSWHVCHLFMSRMVHILLLDRTTITLVTRSRRSKPPRSINFSLRSESVCSRLPRHTISH